MNELRLNATSTIAEVEQALTRLSLAPPDCPLVIPTNLRSRQLGGHSALLQLIVTWRRQCPEGRLRTWVQANDDDEQRAAVLRRLILSDHGLMAYKLAGQVDDRTGATELDGAAESADRRLARMDTLATATRGRKAFLLCVDGTRFAAPASLYDHTPGRAPRPRAESGFRVLARDLRQAITRGPDTKGAAEHIDDPDLARLMMELINNTHEWATRDLHKSPILPSVRGLRAELHTTNPAHRDQYSEELPELQRYLDSEPLQPHGTRRRILELAVFDSGPGMAARALKDVPRPDATAEHMAVHRCLAEHFSASYDSARGIGLHRVLMTLSGLKGFLRLRTGRVHLYRDFVQSPYVLRDRATEPWLASVSEGPWGPAAPVAGTSLSMLFPVTYVP